MRSDIIHIIYQFSSCELTASKCWEMLEPIRKNGAYSTAFNPSELDMLEQWLRLLDMTSDDMRKPEGIFEWFQRAYQNSFGEFGIPVEDTRQKAIELLAMLEM